MAHTVVPSCNGWLDWAYNGGDKSFPSNGGLVCKDFLSASQQCWENVMASAIALLALLYAYPRLRLPCIDFCTSQKQELSGKKVLLLLLCLAFGLELGIKLSARRILWIGNPGHLASMLQIFILAAPPSRIVTAAFRLQMHMLIGIPLVALFPVANTQSNPLEIGASLTRHLLMLIIPFYLMHIGDPYIPEPLGDYSWAMIAFVLLYLSHFLPLQLLAYVSQVNLSSILYPAFSSPGQARFYHLLTFCHQLLLVLTFGKLLVIIAKAFKILPCSDSLDAANVFKPYGKPRPCCRRTCCRTDVWKQHSTSGTEEDHYTDDDSGCVGSSSMLNSGCRCFGGNSHATGCSRYRSPCRRPYPCRHSRHYLKEYNWCCNSENVATRCLVNGELMNGMKVVQGPCKKWACEKSGSLQEKSPSGIGKSPLYRSFLLSDSQDSSPEPPRDRTALAPDIEASRNNYVMSH